MRVLKESSKLLLLFLTTLLIGSTLLFFIKVSITVFHLPVFFLISIALYYLYIRKNNNKDIIKIVSLSLIVIICSTLISSFMFDRSSDGNTYHKDAVGLLKEGFNPVYESSEDLILKRTDDSKKLTNYAIWTDHYAKANWIIEANFYKLTNNIESGKALNFICVYILFGLMFAELSKILDKRKSLILTIITVFNPIVSSQLLTYYNDQLVSIYLFLSILCLIKLDKDINDKNTWIVYIMSFIILFNMKFNGLGYLLVFSFLFACRYLYSAYKNNNFLNIFKKLCLIFISLFITSLVIVGYPTYIKNTIDHNNPFFPLYDDNGEDIITMQQPKTFLEMSTIEKLFYGTFAKANNLRENDKTTIKIPFTFTKDEIIPATSNDLRISGFGLFFSGLLIVSLVVFVKYYKAYKKETWIIFTLLITSMLLLVMSESWWARYTPHFYLFVVLALFILFKYEKKNILSYIYSGIIIINLSVPLLGNSYYTLKNSIKINNDLENLKNKTIEVEVNGMNGIIYNLKDYNIKYKITNIEGKKELYYHYINYKEM